MITPRLECIIKHTGGKIIADIGTDHAYIPIYLIENNLAKRVIASDVKKGPVEIARSHVQNNGLCDKIEIRLGNGLSVLREGEADTIIIAGMGGQLISEIIASHEKTARASSLVLQPMNAQYELRKFLAENNFKITNEDLALEGFKVYNIMNVEEGDGVKFENDIEYHIPKYLKSNKYYRNLYNKKHREFTKVIRGLELSNDVDGEKLGLYKYWLEELEKYEGE